MKTKKLFALVLSFAMLFTTVACGENTTGNNSTSGGGDSDVSTVKIGIITNLTGSGAQGGSYHQAAAEVYRDYINENGGIQSLGGAQIELVVVDGQSDNTQLKTVTQRLLEDD